jgi:hypothetical protein
MREGHLRRVEGERLRIPAVQDSATTRPSRRAWWSHRSRDLAPAHREGLIEYDDIDRYADIAEAARQRVQAARSVPGSRRL